MVTKHAANKPARTPRLPGESETEWTVRSAYLAEKDTGRWTIRYTEIVTDAHGAKKYRTCEQACFTRDKSDAVTILAQWRRHRLTPVAGTGAGQGMLFRDLVDHYLRDVARTRFSRSQHHLLKPALAFFRDDLADAITADRLQAFHDDMLAQRRASGTIRVRLAAVQTALRHGVNQKLIAAASVPQVRLPAPSAPRMYVLTEEQDRAVFEAAAKRFYQGWHDDTERVDHRAALLMCVAADTAQRKGAILAVTWDRINLIPGQEVIDFRRPGHAPTNKRAGIVPVSARLLPVLKHAAALAGPHPAGPLFDSLRIWYGFDRLRAEMNLPKLTPHVFRHTWATLAIKRGMPVSLVAHILADTVATVSKNYVHLLLGDARDAINKYMSPAPPPRSRTQALERMNVVAE